MTDFLSLRTHEGRVAVVTGAARGIGQAVCRMLAECGATVVGSDLDDLSETQSQVQSLGGRWRGVRCDVSSYESVSSLAAEVDRAFGRCDILVNNAGIFPSRDFNDMDYEFWRRVMSINLDGAFFTCKALVPLMKRNTWGRIVNLVSSSVENTVPTMSAYKASKLGLVGFTRGLAPDVASAGICVNCVSPAFTRTPGNLARGPEVALRLEVFKEAQCIKRVAEPEDVVPAILFLTSDAARFMTGQTLYADGGLYFR
jgi:NAD(P)-dependent dehydrogenase (short-subunit alcohol dehydrogenase family)